MRSLTVRHLTIPMILVGGALALPAGADWIKMRDGALVETRGAWKVKGGVVVFTATNGTLSSVRIREVDLDGSAAATFESRQAPAEPLPEIEREPVLVLTNKDVPRAWAGRSAENGGGDTPAAAEDGEDGTPTPQDAAGSLVNVTSWNQAEKPDLDGIELQGVVSNGSPDLISDLRILVRLVGDDGEVLGASNAFLGALSLAPGATTNFRAIFPEADATSFEPRFEVRSNTIRFEAVASPQQDEGSES